MAICMLVAAFSIPCAANPPKEVSQHIAEQRQVAGPGNYSLDLTEQERKDLSERAIAGDLSPPGDFLSISKRLRLIGLTPFIGNKLRPKMAGLVSNMGLAFF